MKEIFQFSALALLFASLLSFTSSSSPSEEKIKWYTWEEATVANEKNPKPMMVDLFTDWCGWCKRMDQTTFKNKEFVKYINQHFYPVKLNAEQKEEIVWNGNTFKYVPNGRRGYHELAFALLEGRMSYPSFVYLNEKFERALISPGFKDAKQMLKELVFVSEKKYLEMTWEDFKKEYEERKERGKKS